MLKGEQGELKTIRNSSFIEYTAQIILNGLLLCAETDADLLVFATLHKQGNDFHFFWSESVVYMHGHGIPLLSLETDFRSLLEVFPIRHASKTVDQCGSRRAAINDPMYGR